MVRVISLGDGRRAWRVNLASAQDVPEFGPPLPYPPIFDNINTLGDWLVQKSTRFHPFRITAEYLPLTEN